MKLLEMSFSGAVFILAVIAIRAAALHHLPKKTFLVLWELVLLRLILPFSLPSIFSIHTLMDRRISAASYLETDAGRFTVAVPQEPQVLVQDMGWLTADRPAVSVWFVVWCIGMILTAVFFIVSYMHCRMEFRTALPVRSAYAEQWIRERSRKRPISIKQSDRIPVPLTYGMFRPVILMPKNTDWENAERLQYVLAHEYVHICRLDAFTKLIAALVLCVHWFNPFVWVMGVLLNRDLELACDESVIRQFGEASRSVYSRMLIHMEAEKSGLLPFCSCFRKGAAEERITAIMKIKRITFGRMLSACLIVFVSAGLFATSAAASSDGRRKVRGPQTSAEHFGSITHESAEILHYENGSPYIHDILTNHTAQTVLETQYGMLAYDENGSPLALYWNFLDSSARSSFENIVQSKENLLPGQTEAYQGGWSLDDETGQTAYVLICLKQVVFEDGSIWKNPDYENWQKTYAGKETSVEELQDYYPHEYRIEFGERK